MARIRRKVYRSLFSLGACLSLMGLLTESGSAHFPFHPHCVVRPRCSPPPIWHTACLPRYTACLPRYTACLPRYNVYCPPRVICPTVVYQPVVYQPICYPTFFIQPVIYDPFPCYTLSYSSTIHRSFNQQPILFAGSAASGSRSSKPSPRMARDATSVHPVVKAKLAAASVPARGAANDTLTSYSPIWTQSAIGLIDDMMERGEWELAHQSLQRMDKISTPLGHSVLLRQAVMDLVAHRESIDTAGIDRILDRLSRATEAGSRLAADELPGASLSAYLRGSRIEILPVLDRLAERVLESPDRSGREMLLLSVLLQLDGQRERSRLFASESRSLAGRSDAFRWSPVLRSLGWEHETDALLASSDGRK